MTQLTQTNAPHTPLATDINWGWISVALGSHIAWGMYPVLGRYLQTVSGLPTFGILAFGNLIILVLIGPMLLKQTRRETLKQPIVWLFTVFVVLRALTNIAAPRYTLSIYV
ncbi:MAG: EamA family transporter, partial [Phototrophicaceae bacterium]